MIGAYCVLVLGIGVALTRRASRNVEEYFLSGRTLPWWLAGTSMAATSFSVDTPLYVTALIREHGIYRSWEWWSWAVGGAVAAFVFAPLWRRARVLTDVELTGLRYRGKAASVLRVFRAFYLALPINCIAMASVYLALDKVLEVTLGVEGDGWLYVFGGVAVVYSLFSGFWGVVVTDVFQFVVAMVAAVVVAVFAVSEVGGLGELVSSVQQQSGGEEVLSFLPPTSGGSFLSSAWIGFAVFIGVAWWANQNADGGGKIIQRMSACKDERNAWLATLWFNIAHYALRTWPWILAALATLVIFPEMEDSEMAYPALITHLLPAGWRGLALVSLIAAFMSTVDTQLNWGASYLVNDVARPLVKRWGRSDRLDVMVSWGAVLLITLVALLLAGNITSVKSNFHFLISFGSGTGSVYVLRWFWWRVTPWSEIAAMVTSGLVSTALRLGWGFDPTTLPAELVFPVTLLVVVGCSTGCWVAVTLLGKAPNPEGLVEFYERVRPGGFWGPVRSLVPESTAAELAGSERWSLRTSLLYVVLGSSLVLGLTVGIGQLLIGTMIGAVVCLGVSLGAGVVLWRGVRAGGRDE